MKSVCRLQLHLHQIFTYLSNLWNNEWFRSNSLWFGIRILLIIESYVFVPSLFHCTTWPWPIFFQLVHVGYSYKSLCFLSSILFYIWRNWYFVTKIVLTYCEKKMFQWLRKTSIFVGEGREFAKILRSLEQFIQTVKGQNNFWK